MQIVDKTIANNMDLTPYRFYLECARFGSQDFRHHTILEAISYLPMNPIVVEIGVFRKVQTVGDKERYVEGASTLAFSIACSVLNGHLWAVDIEAENIEFVKERTKAYQDYVTYVNMDGITFLQGFDKDIDLLYLDAWHPTLQGGLQKHLDAFQSVKTDVKLVMIDDIHDEVHRSKGGLLMPHLGRNGYSQIFCKNHQALYRKDR